LTDEPDLFSGLPEISTSDEDDYVMLDDQWDSVSDGFDNLCRWDEWELPLFANHPLLRAVLNERHPYTWFDPGTPTGPARTMRRRHDWRLDHMNTILLI
jgi:hypothetical protein